MNQIIRFSAAAVILLMSAVPLTAFTSLLEAARSSSMDASILELQRRQAQTELSLMDFVQAPSLTFATGTSRVGTVVDESDTVIFSVSSSPAFIYNLHGDAKTEIEIGISSFSLRDADGPVFLGWDEWSVTPYVLITQPITHFFEDDDEIADIDYALKYLESELAFRRGMIDIDLEVISLLREIAGFDRQLAQLRFEQHQQKQDHQRSLETGTYTEESSRSRTVLQQIDSRERSIESTKLSREFALDELEMRTGKRIDQFPEIPAPDPVLSPSGIGNTSVLMRSLDADRAEKQLSEFRRDHWRLSTYAGYGAAFDEDHASKPGHGIDFGVSGEWRDLTVSAGIEGRIGQHDTLRGTVEGTWAIFDGNRQQQQLEEQQLSYQVEIARQRRELEETGYRRTNQQLELELASWQRDMGRHELEMEYAQRDLEDARRSFERGIGTRRNVDNALSSVEQLEYQRLELMLDGWRLQRSIERHLL